MYKIKLISPLVISFILLIVMIGIIYIGDFTKDTMELTDVQVKLAPDVPEGKLLYELTLDNMVKKYSSNIVVGKVQKADNAIFQVGVIENVLGDISERTIEVKTSKYNLEVGKKYLFFLRKFDSPLYPEPFYTQLNEFIVMIDESDKLWRLEDALNKKYAKLFIDEKYNTLRELKSYINSMKQDNDFIKKPKKPVINEVRNIQELAKLSDHILLIKTNSVNEHTNSIQTLSIVDYDVEQIFKGGDLENIHSLLLPKGILEGRNYLLFLQNTEDGSVQLSTRRGSIIRDDAPNYNDILKELKEIQ